MKNSDTGNPEYQQSPYGEEIVEVYDRLYADFDLEEDSMVRHSKCTSTLLMAVLAVLLIAFLTSCAPDSVDCPTSLVLPSKAIVVIEVTDEALRAEPGSINGPVNVISFQVTNRGDAVHRIAIVETDFPPDALPVEAGRVRPYTYIDEAEHLTFFTSGVGVQIQVPRGYGDEDETQDRQLAPGETVIMVVDHYAGGFGAETRFVLFCCDPILSTPGTGADDATSSKV